MGRKFWRYQTLGGGAIIRDEGWAFEIQGRKVVTYRVETSGFLRKKMSFKAVGETKLSPGLEVHVWAGDASTGSGNCDLKSNGNLMHEYHVFGNVNEFAAAIRAAL